MRTSVWRVYTDEVAEYTGAMLADVLSLEAVRQRVQDAAYVTLTGLESLNATVVDIETRSAAALYISQQALHVTHRYIAADDPLSLCLVCK